MARGTRTNPLVRIDMWIPAQTKEWVKELAEKENKSVTDIVVMALEKLKEEKG